MTAPTAPPDTSVAKTQAQFLALLAASTTDGSYYVYFEDGAVPADDGFDAATFKAALNSAFPDYDSAVPTRTVKTKTKVLKYTTKDTVPVPAVYYTDGQELVVSDRMQHTNFGAYFVVVYGADAGKFVRYEDVVYVLK